jgi:uncharacterized protein (TIGR03435 family)
MAAARWLLMFVATAALLGQPAQRPSFDVATIKPSDRLELGGSMGWRPGGTLHATNLRVIGLLLSAYGKTYQQPLQPAQVIGGPAWTTTDRYDIVGKVSPDLAASPPTDLSEKVPALLQSLLEERFKLKIHWETRELPVYVVRIADRNGKLGPQLHVSSLDCEHERSKCFFRVTPGHLSGGSINAETMVRTIISSLERVVIDKTGLTGKYDFDLEWSPDQTSTDNPSLFAAAREQLGLRIDSERAPVDVVVIDHVERPSEN